MAYLDDRRFVMRKGKKIDTGYSGDVPWRVRWRDPVSGKERSRQFSRKVDAERFLKTVESDVLRGTYVDPNAGKVLFKDYASEWLSTKANLRERSMINVEGRLRNHLIPTFGSRPLSTIRPADVRAWVAEMAAKRSAATVKAAYHVLTQIMRTAEIDGLIAKTPCVGIDLPREYSKQEMVFLSARQVRMLAETIEPRFRVLIYTAAYTGMRAGELSALRVHRLNLVKGTVDIVESASEVRGKWVLGPTKTGARRSLTLPPFLCEMLSAHIEEYGNDDGMVFTSAKGGPLRHHNFSVRQFADASVEAKMPEGLRFHDLRHTCVGLLIAQGAHAKEIQERLGHSTIRLTFDRYGHLLPSLDERLRTGLEDTYREAEKMADDVDDE